MRQRYGKNYFEEYAALTLTQILEVNKDKIIHDECPDLRLPSLTQGVEVTQAIKDDIIFSVRKEKLYNDSMINPFDLAQFENQDEDEISYIKKIEEAIVRKIKKSEHYVSYPSNGLYIFTHCDHLRLSSLQVFMNQIKDSIVFYDIFYFHAIHCVYMYDVRRDTWKTYPLSIEDYIKYNEEALVYEKKKELAYEEKKRKETNL